MEDLAIFTIVILYGVTAVMVGIIIGKKPIKEYIHTHIFSIKDLRFIVKLVREYRNKQRKNSELFKYSVELIDKCTTELNEINEQLDKSK